MAEQSSRAATPELGSLLQQLLGNPDLLQQAMNTAQSLKQSGVLEQFRIPGEVSAGDAAETEAKAVTVLPPATKEHSFDRHRKLLEALLPYLGEARKEKLEALLKLLRLLELAEQAGALKLLGGKEHV